MSEQKKPESADNHPLWDLRLYLCICGFLEVCLQTSAGTRLTGTPKEIPTGQANWGPGPSPEQEVPALALPFQEHQQQEALAGCAWRLQLALPEHHEVRCSLLLGLARQVTQRLVCPGSRRELPTKQPGLCYHPEDTGAGAFLSYYLGIWVCGSAEEGSHNFIHAGQVFSL